MKKWTKYMPTNTTKHGKGLVDFKDPELHAEVQKELKRRQKNK